MGWCYSQVQQSNIFTANKKYVQRNTQGDNTEHKLRWGVTIQLGSGRTQNPPSCIGPAAMTPQMVAELAVAVGPGCQRRASSRLVSGCLTSTLRLVRRCPVLTQRHLSCSAVCRSPPA